jgi:sugar porter (SP) family MFS transporter
MNSLPNNTHPNWVHDPGLRRLNFLLLASYLGAISNGYTSSLISSLIANPLWLHDIHGLSSTKRLGLLTSAHSLGCILAFFPAPYISDKYGRRAGMMLGNVVMICGFTGQVFCSTFEQFLVLRMLVGAASIINTISSAALLVELAHPRQRGVAGALFNTCFFIGSSAAAWTAYGSMHLASAWSWKIPVAAQIGWSLASLSLTYFCPESPQWLIRHAKPDVAKSVLVKYHANGDVEDEFALAEYAAMQTAARTHMLVSGWSSLYATPGNRRRLLLSIVIGVATQWVGNALVSHYLPPVLFTVGITNPLSQQAINGGLQIYVWVLSCSAAILSERAGRRRLFLTSTSTMLVFMVFVTICSAVYSHTGSKAAGHAVIVFLFLFFGGYVIGLTPIPILYVNEIWPQHIRTKGTSVFWVSQAVAVCFNQFVNPIALERIAWRYYLVYIGVLVAVIGFVWRWVPETKGLSLEEIAEMFDKERRGTTALELTRRVSRREDGIEEVRV